jgi:hypothetical protein
MDGVPFFSILTSVSSIQTSIRKEHEISLHEWEISIRNGTFHA